MLRGRGPAGDGRVRELDLLRFMAAAAVLAFHYLTNDASLWEGPGTEVFPEVAPIALLGNYGVELFFLISGFVILMSVWGRGLGEFAVSRVVRLFPAYWFSVVVMLVLIKFVGLPRLDPELTVSNYLTNLTMVHNGMDVKSAHGVYWTLWIELRFYLLIGILAVIGVTYRRCLVFMASWILVGILGNAADNAFLHVVLFWDQSPYFIAGMAYYLMYRFGSSLLLWLFVGTSWVFAMHFAIARMSEPQETLVPGAPYAAMAVITGIFAIGAAVATHRLSRLSWRGLTVLGALTYPLYLFHQVAAMAVIPVLRDQVNRWLVAGITTVVALAVSYLIYRFVERPGQRWLRPRLNAALEQARQHSDPPARLPRVPVDLRRPAADRVPAPVPAAPATAPVAAPTGAVRVSETVR